MQSTALKSYNILPDISHMQGDIYTQISMTQPNNRELVRRLHSNEDDGGVSLPFRICITSSFHVVQYDCYLSQRHESL